MPLFTAQEHYEYLLAPIYAWMVGGHDTAFERGKAEIQALGFTAQRNGIALDLGAGFGIHTIALLEMGFSVTAIDTSPLLLADLRDQATRRGLTVHTIEDDLLGLQKHVARETVGLALCMGDTLTHLSNKDEVVRLFHALSALLLPGGQFLATFRDYTALPAGNARFIPVRSDTTRILTCFLEELPTHVRVHDLLYQWDGSAWKLQTSSYDKLRLTPEWVRDQLVESGFATTLETGAGGLRRILAIKQ